MAPCPARGGCPACGCREGELVPWETGRRSDLQLYGPHLFGPRPPFSPTQCPRATLSQPLEEPSSHRLEQAGKGSSWPWPWPWPGSRSPTLHTMAAWSALQGLGTGGHCSAPSRLVLPRPWELTGSKRPHGRAGWYSLGTFSSRKCPSLITGAQGMCTGRAVGEAGALRG